MDQLNAGADSHNIGSDFTLREGHSSKRSLKVEGMHHDTFSRSIFEHHNLHELLHQIIECASVSPSKPHISHNSPFSIATPLFSKHFLTAIRFLINCQTDSTTFGGTIVRILLGAFSEFSPKILLDPLSRLLCLGLHMG